MQPYQLFPISRQVFHHRKPGKHLHDVTDHLLDDNPDELLIESDELTGDLHELPVDSEVLFIGFDERLVKKEELNSDLEEQITKPEELFDDPAELIAEEKEKDDGLNEQMIESKQLFDAQQQWPRMSRIHAR